MAISTDNKPKRRKSAHQVLQRHVMQSGDSRRCKVRTATDESAAVGSHLPVCGVTEHSDRGAYKLQQSKPMTSNGERQAESVRPPSSLIPDVG
ncbi:hypothetical protein AtubIFM56815_004698 [Aspergillus tubingensis]|uniref:Uncharacterized protein n=1 Tax=Aspergillus tubingensis TaxID=5068 RepID=A0A9W6AKC2_ASPTU|nr:hypothetical protein AtubIFM56815_004698 [Aspergillus tubingensis]GLB17829.1 hypothetical protein AtubIFM61612_007718 [Aspergillus tubingensis]